MEKLTAGDELNYLWKDKVAGSKLTTSSLSFFRVGTLLQLICCRHHIKDRCNFSAHTGNYLAVPVS